MKCLGKCCLLPLSGRAPLEGMALGVTVDICQVNQYAFHMRSLQYARSGSARKYYLMHREDGCKTGRHSVTLLKHWCTTRMHTNLLFQFFFQHQHKTFKTVVFHRCTWQPYRWWCQCTIRIRYFSDLFKSHGMGQCLKFLPSWIILTSCSKNFLKLNTIIIWSQHSNY